MGDTGQNLFCAFFLKMAGGHGESTGSFGQIVHQKDVFSAHIPDNSHGFDFGRAPAAFGDDGEAAFEHLRIGVCHFQSADVRADDDKVFQLFLFQIIIHHWRGVEMIDGDVEKALNLLRVEVHREDAISASGYDEVSDEFGGNGDARLVFAVLAGITIERQNGGDAVGASAADGIDHDEQFHQVMVGGRAGGLNDVNVFASHIFLDFDEGFAVGKGFDG